jgi:hypothetical protein
MGTNSAQGGTMFVAGVFLETHKTTILTTVDNLCRIVKHCRLQLKPQD